MILEAGTRLAVIGENGAGKTTFLRCLINELKPDHGTIKWAENASLGYCPQDSTAEFDCDTEPVRLDEPVAQTRPR